MQQKQGKYDKAALNYKLYLSEHSGDDEYRDNRSKVQMAACEWAQKELDSPRANINLSHLGEEVNSPYSEFGGILSGEGMYYTSYRFTKEDSEDPKEKMHSIAW